MGAPFPARVTRFRTKRLEDHPQAKLDLAAGGSAPGDAATGGSVVKAQRVAFGSDQPAAAGRGTRRAMDVAAISARDSSTLNDAVVNRSKVGPVEDVEKLGPELHFHILICLFQISKQKKSRKKRDNLMINYLMIYNQSFS